MYRRPPRLTLSDTPLPHTPPFRACRDSRQRRQPPTPRGVPPMIDQRSEAWFAERAGKITGSMMHVVMLERDRAPFKTGPRKGQPKPPPKALTDRKSTRLNSSH